MQQYTIGDRITVLLVTKNMAQSELSKLSGVPASSIHEIRNGKNRKPSFDTVLRLAQALEVSVCYLGTGREETKKSR